MAELDTPFRRAFLERFPEGRRLERALQDRQNQNPLFFFMPSEDPDLQGCWLVLGRLGLEIEGRFGLSSEVLFAFAPHRDYQRRNFNALTQRARRELAVHQVELFETERFTPDPSLAFVSSPDPRLSEKLSDYNSSGAHSYAIPLPELSSDRETITDGLARAIASVFEERDLYKGRNPVTGNDFFGRSNLLRELSTEVKQGRSIGLFGLRRSGKTSVIREFQRRNQTTGILVVLSDLEAAGPIEDMAGQIGADLTDGLRLRKQSDSTIYIGSGSEIEIESFAELSKRMKRVAERNPHLQFVVALDEIEHLGQYVAEDAQQVRTFLGALRKSAQATSNITLLFTGVTTHFFSRAKLDSQIGNPLFGFVESIYLKPFESHETRNLLKSLGQKMLLEWTDEATDLAHVSAGGFPFLVRNLGSRVRTLASARRVDALERVRVTADDVLAVRPTWAEESVVLWDEIRDDLKSHHPIMAELLASSQGELNQWLSAGSEAVESARALEHLGLLERSDGEFFRPSEALSALQNLSNAPSATVDDVRKQIDAAETIKELIRSPEGPELEFKSTARWNLHAQRTDRDIEFSVVKTVAGFLNQSGGSLVVGVDDDGEVIGLDSDLSIYRNDLDKYQNWLLTLLGDSCGMDNAAQLIEATFPEVDEARVCLIQVAPADDPVWVSYGDAHEAFFVRVGNSTRQLTGRDQFDFIQRRFGL